MLKKGPKGRSQIGLASVRSGSPRRAGIEESTNLTVREEDAAMDEYIVEIDELDDNYVVLAVPALRLLSHALLVVDSVHSWAEAAPTDVDEYTALNDGLAALRRIARNLQCPVLAIAERNRAKMSVGGLDASAGSRRFEYGAESVLALNREKDEGADGEAKITLTIEKNRNGASGRRISLLFNGALQRFNEV
jgi:hypothetical protein